MMALSYSKCAKEALKESGEKKKKCCQRMLDDIVDLAKEKEALIRLQKLSASCGHFKCGSCYSYFLRGLFIAFGNVTDPSKAYHLELSFKTQEERDCVFEILCENGNDMKKAVRKGRFLLYIKDSTLIEDFFAMIGANKLAFDLMNSKIVREVMENTNRQINCDMANIQKSISAAEHYSEIISELQENGTIMRLPTDLRETARLRIENNQASLADLGRLHNPPISKSGVKHRLDKILDFYKDINSK
ncbi:MAG: DNA-binding protein WhiA [Ruminococcaceae bacterium]|nr:DNA-binding protein WhiA [Oscillospiraceae bacterium]